MKRENYVQFVQQFEYLTNTWEHNPAPAITSTLPTPRSTIQLLLSHVEWSEANLLLALLLHVHCMSVTLVWVFRWVLIGGNWSHVETTWWTKPIYGYSAGACHAHFATPTFATHTAGISDSSRELYSWSVGYESGVLPWGVQGMNSIHNLYKYVIMGCGHRFWTTSA